MNLDETISKNRGIIDTLPSNTNLAKNKKKDFILKEIETFNRYKSESLEELKKRYSKLNDLSENPLINSLKSDLEKINLFKEWNEYNTSYEKMHLDYYLYHLHRYYKEDLKSVNTCLYSLLTTFSNVGVILEPKDFNYHPYATEYIDAIINHKENETHIHDIFEEIYWKCSDIIRILEMNFKSLYYKNIKKINKYYSDRKEQILKNNTTQDIFNTYYSIVLKKKDVESTDGYTILQKFINKEVALSDISFETTDKKTKRIFKDFINCTPVILMKLYDSLEEYQWYNKYQFIISDMRERLKNKEQYKGNYDNKMKEILKKEKELLSLVSKSSKMKKKPLIKSKSDKLMFQIQEAINVLKTLYLEFDEIKYNNLIYEKLESNCAISEVLKIASSNYLYFIKLKKTIDDNINIKDATLEFRNFMNAMNCPNFTVLNNIYILDEKNIAEIICDRYKLLNVLIEESDLETLGLENYKKDVSDLLLAHSMKQIGITKEDIDFYLEMKKVKLFEPTNV